MSWMDWGDVRAKRGSPATGKKHKASAGWKEGGTVAKDAAIARKNHEKAMREQKERQRKAQAKEDARQRRLAAEREEKARRKEVKRVAKEARKRQP